MTGNLSLPPDKKMGVSAAILEMLSEFTFPEGQENSPGQTRQAIWERILEALRRDFSRICLHLTHADKTQFVWRIRAFLEEAEKSDQGANILKDARIFHLKFELLAFSLAFATNAAERMPHITQALQTLLQEIHDALEELKVYHDAAA